MPIRPSTASPRKSTAPKASAEGEKRPKSTTPRRKPRRTARSVLAALPPTPAATSAVIARLNQEYQPPLDLDELRAAVGPGGSAPLSFVVSKAQLSSSAGGHGQRALAYVDPQKLELAFAGSPLYIGQYGANPRGEAALQDSRARVLAAFSFMRSGQRLLVSCATLDGYAESLSCLPRQLLLQHPIIHHS